MTLHNCHETDKALECFERAEQIDPKNPLNKYQKGTVLMSLDHYEEALKVLQDLTYLAPKEAPVHIMIGKAQRKLGQKDLALKSFHKALDLDPKDTNMVKSLIDKIDSNIEMSDEAELQL